MLHFKNIFLISIPFFTLILTGCVDQQEEQIRDENKKRDNSKTSFVYNMIPQEGVSVITESYNSAINSFSVNILNEVYKTHEFNNKNVIISPLSVNRNLAMIAEATTGVSQQELLKVLGGQTALDDAQAALRKLLYADISVVLQMADALWLDSMRYVLQDTFMSLASKKYGVYTQGLHFGNATQTVDIINQWISDNTNNYIRNFMDRSWITPYTSAILTSTIYFEANWESPFDITKTTRQQFYSPQGKVSVDMMVSGYEHRTFKNASYQNAKIFYGNKGKNFFFLDLYMPESTSIGEFIEKECLVALGAKMPERYGGLRMPKFSFEKTVDLKPVLKSIGVNRIFDSSATEITKLAILKNSADTQRLYIERIEQKAGIKTDEEGTVAYAVTAASMGDPTSIGGQSPDIVLDHPFVYFIRAGESGLVLFAGVVNDPRE